MATVSIREGECVPFKIDFAEFLQSIGARTLDQGSHVEYVQPFREDYAPLTVGHSVSSADGVMSVTVQGGQGGGEYQIGLIAVTDNCSTTKECFIVKVEKCR